MFVQGEYISFTAAGNLLTSPSLCKKLRVVVSHAVEYFIIGIHNIIHDIATVNENRVCK
jgi:hypothetical protein